MQIIAGARGRPLEIGALPKPGKSTIARLIVAIADVRGGLKSETRRRLRTRTLRQCFVRSEIWSR